MRTNNQHSELERARDALWAIPASLPRTDWVTAGMSFHAAGGDAYTFEKWSATAPDQYNAAQCKATWRSFKAKPGGVGPGTLFAMARAHGWQDHSKPHAQRTSPLADFPIFAPKQEQPRPTGRPGMTATEIWDRCNPATSAHAYVQAKAAEAVPLEGLRVVPDADPLSIGGNSMAGALAVPAYSPDGELQSLQLIPPQGPKMNLTGHAIGGAYYVVGELVNGGVANLVEGIGQAWACWQATNAAAVVCFGWGNVRKVAAALRMRDPDLHIVLVPDTGKEADAAKLAAEHQCSVAYMPDGEAQNFDANDLAQRDGLEALAALLTAAQAPAKPLPRLIPVSVCDVLTHRAPPPAFVWEGYAPAGVVTLMGAHGGTGKSTIALMLAVAVSMGRPLFGVPTTRCKTLFVSLEDSAATVRHRLAKVCTDLCINPAELDGLLHIVDGTEWPELFTAEGRNGGDLTATYHELESLILETRAGLCIVDNASDAFGGDEINRRQVRAFMRDLGKLAKLTPCAMLLLAHVDKGTSRERTSKGGEGYSGSTAWHNSARSRLFITRAESGDLTLEHQKSNFGKMHEPLALVWPPDGLPQIADSNGHDNAYDPADALLARADGRAQDEKAAALLRILAEFESRGMFASPAPQARTNVHALLRVEPAFQRLKLNKDATARTVNQCQRAGWIEVLEYRTPARKPGQRWTLTALGRDFAGLPAPVAPTAPTAPTCDEGAPSAQEKQGAPTAPTCVGGMGERARADEGATEEVHHAQD